MGKTVFIGIWVLSLLCVIHAGENTTVNFNPSFFSGTNIDTTSLFSEMLIEPGVYDVEVYENNENIGIRSITVRNNNDGKSDIYFNKSILSELKLKKDLNDYYMGLPDTSILLDNDDFGIKVKLDTTLLSVNINVPQTMMNNIPRGYVDPKYWEDGETAAIFNYNANYYSSQNTQGSKKLKYNNFFSSINTWINIGPWQFRNNSTMIANDDYTKFDTQNTYVQRDIAKLFSVIRVGEVYSQQSVLPVVPVLGVSLFSDERMLPDSKRGYVPSIRGVANSNAKVTVRQNNNIIYETTVAPGPFIINDLFQVGTSGDFNVTVQEADGEKREFIVPYAYLPDLMRPDQSKYSFSLGALNINSLYKKPLVSAITYNRGINNSLTGFTAAQLSQYYQSGLIGLAFNTEIGAFSTNIAFSNADLGFKKSQGYNLGISYANIINSIDTSISLATYRYSSSGFKNLQDALTVRDNYDHLDKIWDYNFSSINIKNSMQVNINQPVGNGSFYVSAMTNDYWGSSTKDSTFQIGYSNQYGHLSYTASVAKTKNLETDKYDTLYQIGLSSPLGKSNFSPRLSTSYAKSYDNNGYFSASLNGTALTDRRVSYGLNTNIDSSNSSNNTISGNLSTLTALGSRSANVSYSKNTRQSSLSMNGSTAIHKGGVTFGQYVGDTVGIVYAEGAKGATISGNTNVRIDSRGYAIYPYLSPYKNNKVSLNPNSANSDVELTNSARYVVPVAGSIVKVEFETVTGDFQVYEIKHNGQNLPLGAIAKRNNSLIGTVGGGGILMLRENENSRINMTWNDKQTENSCSFNIEKQEQIKSIDIVKKPINCI